MLYICQYICHADACPSLSKCPNHAPRANWNLACHAVSCVQAVVLQAVQDNAVGQPQFEIALYVTAVRDANITGNRQLVHVVDQRLLPGEDTSFPLVRSLHSGCS